MVPISAVSFLILAVFSCLDLASRSKLTTETTQPSAAMRLFGHLRECPRVQNKHQSVLKCMIIVGRLYLRWHAEAPFHVWTLTTFWPPPTSSRSPWGTPRSWGCLPRWSFQAAEAASPLSQWPCPSSKSHSSSSSEITERGGMREVIEGEHKHSQRHSGKWEE